MKVDCRLMGLGLHKIIINKYMKNVGGKGVCIIVTYNFDF